MAVDWLKNQPPELASGLLYKHEPTRCDSPPRIAGTLQYLDAGGV
jgi:hypothetical protein